MTMFSDSMMLGGGMPPPVITSFSQSGLYVGDGTVAATVSNMSDGFFVPQTATSGAGMKYVMANLAASAFVVAIILGPPNSIAAGGWSEAQLNGADLEISNDNGLSWTTIRTLSGYVAATGASTGAMKTEAIGASCTNIRVTKPSSNVALSEFKLAP